MKKQFLKTTKESYDETAQDYAQKATQFLLLSQREEFIKMLSSKAKILDLGCGSGRDAKFFSEKGFQLIGIDFSPKLLEIAKKTAPLAQFYEMDMQSLTFEENSFDGIWSCASL